MKREELAQPAVPPPVDENGWPISSNAGFNKLEAASLQIGQGLLSLDASWEVMFSEPKPETSKTKGRYFDQKKFAENAVRLAVAILDECKKHIDEAE
jgi:hypothetical protein